MDISFLVGPVSIDLETLKDKYSTELLGIAIVALFAFVAIIGRRQNNALAKAVGEVLASRGPLAEQFARCRPDDAKQHTAHVVHMRESPSMFRMWFSGRRGCLCAHLRMIFRRRHDLFASLVYLLVPMDDEIVLEAMFSPEDMPYEGVVAVTKGGSVLESLTETYKEVRTAAPLRMPLVGDFVAHVEHRELLDNLLLSDTFLRRVLTAEGDGVEEVVAARKLLRHVLVSSDVHYELAGDSAKGSSGEDLIGSRMRVLSMRLRIPSAGSAGVARLLPYVTSFLNLIDVVTGFKYTPKTKEKLMEKRGEAQKEKERLERLAREKEATLRRHKKEEEAEAKMRNKAKLKKGK